jgi:three-Cys-motif partner protein
MIILSQGKFAEILYIDGFAGPGEYAGGEAGSPIIALDTALELKPPLTAKVHFLFVEERDDRADHLRKQVALRTLPANFSAIVEGGVTFEVAFEKRYSGFVRNGRLMPTFAFIDPFGWTGSLQPGQEDSSPTQLRGFCQFHVRGNQSVHRSSGSGAEFRQLLWGG